MREFLPIIFHRAEFYFFHRLADTPQAFVFILDTTHDQRLFEDTLDAHKRRQSPKWILLHVSHLRTIPAHPLRFLLPENFTVKNDLPFRGSVESQKIGRASCRERV